MELAIEFYKQLYVDQQKDVLKKFLEVKEAKKEEDPNKKVS